MGKKRRDAIMTEPIKKREHAENVAHHDRVKAVHDILTQVKKNDPAKYNEIIKNIKAENPKCETLGFIELCNFIAQKENETLFNQIKKAGDAFRAKITQAGLRPSKSTKAEALDLAKTADQAVNKLEKKICLDNKLTVKELGNDAKIIAKAFTPRSVIAKAQNGSIVERQATGDDLKKVDAIIVNGNNDLKQVDHAAKLFIKMNNPQCKIYVSGFGGHATSPGYIFSKTEAETLGARLESLGVAKESIVLEKEATNSGENISFVVQKMQNERPQPKIILICGTPAAILRQARSFEQQAKYDWNSILTYPPADLSPYYETDRDAIINIMCSLREVASFIDYTINSAYMSPRMVQDEQSLLEGIGLLVKYYNILNPSKKINDTQLENFQKKFIEFSRVKAQAAPVEKLADLKKEIQALQKPIADYFRAAFNQIELAWVKVLSSDLSSKEHRQFINNFADYKMNSLDIE